MKVNELINSFEIFITNEERSIYENMNERAALVQFNEREQFIIQNLHSHNCRGWQDLSSQYPELIQAYTLSTSIQRCEDRGA